MSDVKYIIKHLLEENTTESWTEAICIALSQLKDKDGKALRVFLSKDYGNTLNGVCRLLKH